MPRRCSVGPCVPVAVFCAASTCDRRIFRTSGSGPAQDSNGPLRVSKSPTDQPGRDNHPLTSLLKKPNALKHTEHLIAMVACKPESHDLRPLETTPCRNPAHTLLLQRRLLCSEPVRKPVLSRSQSVRPAILAAAFQWLRQQKANQAAQRPCPLSHTPERTSFSLGRSGRDVGRRTPRANKADGETVHYRHCSGKLGARDRSGMLGSAVSCRRQLLLGAPIINRSGATRPRFHTLQLVSSRLLASAMSHLPVMSDGGSTKMPGLQCSR